MSGVRSTAETYFSLIVTSFVFFRLKNLKTVLERHLPGKQLQWTKTIKVY